MSGERPARVSGGAAVAPTAKRVEWTGELRRGAEDGAVRGWLFCAATGERIEFNGVRDPRPGHGYVLVGKAVPV